MCHCCHFLASAFEPKTVLSAESYRNHSNIKSVLLPRQPWYHGSSHATPGFAWQCSCIKLETRQDEMRTGKSECDQIEKQTDNEQTSSNMPGVLQWIILDWLPSVSLCVNFIEWTVKAPNRRGNFSLYDASCTVELIIADRNHDNEDAIYWEIRMPSRYPR